jgi:hypothetical protein
LEIIEKFGYKDIVIGTQDDFKNPCINELKRLLPDIRIQTSDLFNVIAHPPATPLREEAFLRG